MFSLGSRGRNSSWGLKLHNLSLFDKILKLIWLKRFIISKCKWTVFPNDFELSNAFISGSDYLERITEATSGIFWLDVIKGFEKDAVLGQDLKNNSPLWMNPNLRILIKREWLNKGINTIAYFLGPMRCIIPMSEFMENFNVKTLFLEYKSITIKIKNFVEWKEIPLNAESAARNSSLNVLLNLSENGCS